jgi:uncharacterized protein
MIARISAGTPDGTGAGVGAVTEATVELLQPDVSVSAEAAKQKATVFSRPAETRARGIGSSLAKTFSAHACETSRLRRRIQSVNRMPVSRRLLVFLTTTFALTWGAWWSVAFFSPVKGLTFENPGIVSLYLLGGFGPTIAAFVAICTTPGEGSLRDFTARLFRWRAGAGWYAVAFGVPPLLGMVHAALALPFGAGGGIGFESLSRLLPLFGMMIVGGGLEELGWRGVALPELANRSSRLAAATWVSIVWVLWHLPLFFIHGVSQYHSNFALFALYTSGNSFLLAWLYFATRSILLCVAFHAASNTTTAMIVLPATSSAAPDFIAAALSLALGIVLVATSQRRTGTSIA